MPAGAAPVRKGTRSLPPQGAAREPGATDRFEGRHSLDDADRRGLLSAVVTARRASDGRAARPQRGSSVLQPGARCSLRSSAARSSLSGSTSGTLWRGDLPVRRLAGWCVANRCTPPFALSGLYEHDTADSRPHGCGARPRHRRGSCSSPRRRVASLLLASTTSGNPAAGGPTRCHDGTPGFQLRLESETS